eukprot:2145477-Amphidinium_carterae.1
MVSWVVVPSPCCGLKLLATERLLVGVCTNQDAALFALVFLLHGCADWNRQNAATAVDAKSRLSAFTVSHAASQLRCRAVEAEGTLVVGVKTTRFYHATRTTAQWEAWVQRLQNAVMYATDGAFAEAATWPASVLVVEDSADMAREEAYIP